MASLFPPNVVKSLNPVGALSVVAGSPADTATVETDTSPLTAASTLAALPSPVGGSNVYQTKLFDMLSNPTIDQSAKWMDFAAAMGAPTKTGGFSESLSGGLSALAKGEREEQSLKNQYKTMMLQQLGQLSEMEMAGNLIGGGGGIMGTDGVPGSGNANPGVEAVRRKAMALEKLGFKEAAASLLKTLEPITSTGDVLKRDANGKISLAFEQPKLSEGMRAVRDPVSGEVIGTEQIPEYGDIVAKQKGSEAGAVSEAQSQYKLMPISTPNGAIMVTEAQAIEMAGGKPKPKEKPPLIEMKGMTPQQIFDMGNKIQDPKEKADFLKTLQSLAQSGSVDITKPSNAKPAIGIAVQGKDAEAADIEQGKFFASTYSDLQKGAMVANTQIAKLDRMSSLLEDIDTGKLTPTGTEIAAHLKSIGIDIDPNLGNKQAAQSMSRELALALRNPAGGAGMPGAMSDADREFLVSMAPSLSNDPNANKILIKGMKLVAQREREIAKLARNYKGGKLDNDFYTHVQAYADSRPLFTDLIPKGAGLPNGVPPGAKLDPTRKTRDGKPVYILGGKAYIEH